MSTVPPDDKRPFEPTNAESARADADALEQDVAESASAETTIPENTDAERFVVSSQGETTDADASVDPADPVFVEPVIAEPATGAAAADEPELEEASEGEPEPALASAHHNAAEPALPAGPDAATETSLPAAPDAATEPALPATSDRPAEPSQTLEPEPLIEPEPYVPTPPPAVIIPPAVILPDAATPAAASTAPAAAGAEETAVAAETESAIEQRERSNAETAILSPEVLVAPVAVAAAVAQPADTRADVTQPGTGEPAATAAPSDIDAVPPRRKGNRGFGILLALAGSVVFAGVHAGITALVYLVAGRSFDIESFVTSSAFIVPTATFLVVFVLAALIINRAGWWAWALGSLVVAVVTYFASSGVILLLADIMTLTPSQAEEIWMSLLFSAPLIIALVVAREVSLWFGALISVRGRKVKARNAEARAAYDRDREQLATNSAI